MCGVIQFEPRLKMILHVLICLMICVSVEYILCAPLGGFLLESQRPKDRSVLERGPGYSTSGHQQVETAKSRGIKPIVDTIREEDKYGNDGGKIRVAGNAFIRLTEGTSGSVSRLIGKPNENTYNVLEGLTPLFANIGRKIAGLA